SDGHTHAHDLPPQMGCCLASGTPEQQALARRIDAGPWGDGAAALIETRQSEPADAAEEAARRLLRHHQRLLAVNPEGLPRGTQAAERLDQALRCALTHLLEPEQPLCPPPLGSAAGLRYLRDRISVPRDMPLHAARLLRRCLEATARLDPADPLAAGEPIPLQHRRDQDPSPFLAAAGRPLGTGP
ncbi:MAG: glutathione S-transferase, partial [Cyanobium sp.]